MNLTHQRLWNAFDALAEKHGLSASGLAKRAGLDATSFNPSKRTTKEGKLRWPSAESIAKVLEATNTPLTDWAALIVGEEDAHTLPLVSLGKPVWDDELRIPFPDLNDLDAFAIRLSGNAHLPLYPHDTLLVLSPRAEIEAGARVLVRSHGHGQFLGQVHEKTPGSIRLSRIDRPDSDLTLPQAEIIAITRIVWASQ